MLMFPGVSANVKQGTQLQMSTEGFDVGRFATLHALCLHIECHQMVAWQ